MSSWGKYQIMAIFLALIFLITGAFAAVTDSNRLSIPAQANVGVNWVMAVNDCQSLFSDSTLLAHNCAVDWNGPTTGKFTNAKTSYVALPKVGEYTFTLTDCTNISCTNKEIIAVKKIKIVVPAQYYLASSFDAVNKKIYFAGYGNNQATAARALITVKDLNGNFVYDTNVVVNGNTQYFGLPAWLSVNSWPRVNMQATAKFYNASGVLIGTSNTIRFDYLALVGTKEAVPLLQDAVNNLGNDVSTLYADSNRQDAEINDLNTRLIDLEEWSRGVDSNIYSILSDINDLNDSINSQIDEINSNLSDIDANIQTLFGDVEEITDEMREMSNDIDGIKFNIFLIRLNLLSIREDIVEINSHLSLLDGKVRDIQVQIREINKKIIALSHGTVWLEFSYPLNKLTITGHAPLGARIAHISVGDIDGARFTDGAYRTDVNVDASEYKAVLDTTTWDKQMYQIYVSFSDSSMAEVGNELTTPFNDLAILAEFEGFHFKENMREEYFLVLPTTFQINFKFGSLVDEQYNFSLLLTDENGISYRQELISSYVGGYSSKTFNTRFDVPNNGNWSAKLIASIAGADVAESNDFSIEVVDMFDSLEGEIVGSEPWLNYNSHSIQADTFYTNKDFNIVMVIKGSSLGIDCRIKLGNEVLHSVRVNGNTCSTMAFKQNVFGGEEGLFVLQMDNIVNNITPTSMNVGIDYTNPVFATLNGTPWVVPSAGYHAGIVHIDANAKDYLSGILSMEFLIVDKNTKSIAYSMYADYNSITGLYESDFNSLLVPDTFYDINAIAIDVAGNSTNVMVDPGFDNTAPTVNDVNIVPYPSLRGLSIRVDADITDNFSGVNPNTVIAKITDGNIRVSISMDLNNGIYSGVFDTNKDWNLGFYTVTVIAKDNAGNESLPYTDASTTLLENYILNAPNSITISEGNAAVIDGNIISETGNVPIDGNVLLLSSTGNVTAALAEFDANGVFKITTSTLAAGTYIVDINYNTIDYNYTKRVTLTVNAVQGNGGGSGGSRAGGAPRPTLDTNVPVVETPVVPEIDNNTPDTNTIQDLAPLPTLDVVDNNSPTQPTAAGLFGFADLGGFPLAGLGLLLLILITGGLFLFFKNKK
jgi:peptidoglycan hydrolase CwlO-like protein